MAGSNKIPTLSSEHTETPRGVGDQTIFGQGDWIGDYEILSRIRHGGMATLYLGRKHGTAGFARNAAIKVIHPHLSADDKFVRMFVDEARICSQISHPNVIHVEEFGQERGLHYLVMEYVESCSLSELLRRNRKRSTKLDPELAAHIILQVAGGLHAAHESRGMDGLGLGIVHRDVSPSNILLSTDGHIKVIDFGIAKSRGRLAQTQAGQALKGKLKYMAPEQAEVRDIDRRADIFSLGVVFWEVLVGEPLFQDDSELALLKRLTEPDITLPSIANPEVPPELDAVVMAMLEQNPEDRPETALDARRLIIDALPKAATRQAEELGQVAIEIISQRRAGTQDIAGISVDPLGSGSISFIRTPPRQSPDYEEVYLDARDPAPQSKSLLSQPVTQVALLLAVIGVSVLLTLKIAGVGEDNSDSSGPTVVPSQPAAVVPAAPATKPVPPPADERAEPEPAKPPESKDDIDEESRELAKKAARRAKRDRKARKRNRSAEKSGSREADDKVIKRGATTIVDSFDEEETSESKQKTIRRGKTEISTDFGD